MKAVQIADVPARDDSDNPIFRGRVTVQSILGDGSDGMRAIVVNFSQGAVNVFHTHTFDQVLYVTAGKGIVATEQEEVRVTPGTLIHIPAGERHWHGATEDSAFSHIAIMPPGRTEF